MPEAESDDLLPIFPLSNVVLFPEVRVPLHLFEPRYRELARDALAGDRRIGMVAVRPEHIDDMGGDPPVFAIGCEGVIEESQELPDGRYNIVLRGTHCFRIVREHPPSSDRSYRLAHVEPLPQSAGPAEIASVAARRDEIIELLLELLRRIAPEQAQALDSERFAGIDEVTFVNALAQSLELSTPEKQALLEANSVSQRCEGLVAMLRFRLAEHSAGEPSGSGNVH